MNYASTEPCFGVKLSVRWERTSASSPPQGIFFLASFKCPSKSKTSCSWRERLLFQNYLCRINDASVVTKTSMPASSSTDICRRLLQYLISNYSPASSAVLLWLWLSFTSFTNSWLQLNMKTYMRPSWRTNPRAWPSLAQPDPHNLGVTRALALTSKLT